MEGNYIKIVIGAVLILLVIVSVAIPILDGINYTETGENTPTGYATNSIMPGTYTLTTNGFAIDDTEIATVDSRSWVIVSDTFSLIKWNASSFFLHDYAANEVGGGSSVTISSDGTWSMGQKSGSIGSNAITRSQSGSIPVYYKTSFNVNLDASILTTAVTTNVTIGGVAESIRLIVSGTPNDLTVVGACMAQTNNTITFLDPEDVKVELIGLESNDHKTYTITKDTKIRTTLTYSGTEYTADNGFDLEWVGPLTYTKVTHGPVESMINIAPLIMIAGVIVAMIGTIAVRRL